MDEIYANTDTDTHMRVYVDTDPPLGSQKQIYEAIKAHLSEMVTHTNTDRHMHTS